jgi:hypothetical protein
MATGGRSMNSINDKVEGLIGSLNNKEIKDITILLGTFKTNCNTYFNSEVVDGLSISTYPESSKEIATQLSEFGKINYKVLNHKFMSEFIELLDLVNSESDDGEIPIFTYTL